MMSDHSELVGEMLLLEKMAMVDRLKLAKKRRAQQLKAYYNYEKQLGKEGGSNKKLSKFLGKSLSASMQAPTRQKSSKKGSIRWESSTLLLDAASRNDKEEVYQLLSSGVSPNSCNEDGLTALHQCCIDNLEDIVKILIQFGANVNSRDTELWTPLHAAATCGHTSLCKHLCEKGAELLAVNIDGNMPYDLCEDGKTLDYIESQMANAGVTQEMIDNIRMTSENHMLNDLKRIQAEGGDLQFTGPKGETPLHVAASNGYTNVTEFLLKHKAAIDCRDDEGWQPIHCAAAWGQLPVVEILMQHKANPEAQIRTGESALDLCEDMEVRTTMLNMMKEIAQQHLMPRKLSRFGFDSSRRRSSATRRGSNVTAHGIRRASIHDKAPLAHREAAEEAQRLQESMASMANLDDDDDDDGITLPACTLPPSSTALYDSPAEDELPPQPVNSADVQVELKSETRSQAPSINPVPMPSIVVTSTNDPEFEVSSLRTPNVSEKEDITARSNGTISHPEANGVDLALNSTHDNKITSSTAVVFTKQIDTSVRASAGNPTQSCESATIQISSSEALSAGRPLLHPEEDPSVDQQLEDLKRLRGQRLSANSDDVTMSNNNGNIGRRSGTNPTVDHSSSEQSTRSRIMGSSVKKKFNSSEVVHGDEKEQAGCCSIM